MAKKNLETWEEIGRALGELTPKQVYYLAKLGQKVLGIGGTGIAPRLIGLATGAMYDQPKSDNTAALEALEVAKAVAEIRADELAEGLTLAELTGVTIENEIYGVPVPVSAPVPVTGKQSRRETMANQLGEFLNTNLPENWGTYTLKDRRQFFKTLPFDRPESSDVRTEFCPAEFVCEFLGMNEQNKDYKRTVRRVNKLMRDFPDWEEVGKVNHVRALYGRLRGFRKRQDLAELRNGEQTTNENDKEE